MGIVKASGFFSSLAKSPLTKSPVARGAAIGAAAGAVASDKGDGTRGAITGAVVGAAGGKLLSSRRSISVPKNQVPKQLPPKPPVTAKVTDTPPAPTTTQQPKPVG